MRETLEAFAYGELRTENLFEEKLKAVLDENGIEALNKLSGATSDITDISCIERFIFG